MNKATLEMVIRTRKELSGIEATIQRVKKMKRTFANTARSIASSAKAVVAAVQKMRAAMVKLHAAFRTLRNVALRAFTALVAFTGIPILKFFGDFEQAMANVNTLLDVSTQKFDQMGKGVIQISNRIGESAVTLSNALYDIVSAGVSSADSLDVLDISARAAKAGMTQAKTAVNAGMATINSYNLAIQDLNKVYDLQFTTVRKGVITYEQLAGSIGQLLPSARKLDEQLESVYGSLAFVTKQGLSADLASVSLARTFDALAEKSDKLAKAGVDVYDQFGNFRGIVSIIEDLSGKLEGLTNEEMMDILGDIGFEKRAARAIIPMIKNIDGLKESVDAMDDSSGAMAEAFKKATDTVQWHAGRAKENVVNAFRNMGSAWAEEIKNMMDSISGWAGAIQIFVSQNKNAIKSILNFAIRLAGIITVVAAVGTAIFALSTPIGAITAGIMILGSAWYLNIYDIRGWTQKMWDIVGPILEDMWQMLGKAWTWTIEAAGKAWDWMTNTTWKEKWDDIKSWMQDGWEWTVDLAGGAWEWMEKKSPELTGKLETAWQWSASVANDLMQWIIDVAWPWIRDAAVTTWEWSVEAANDSFNWVVNTAAPWIGKTVSSTWDWTVNGVNEIKNIQLDDNALAQAAAMAIKATIEWTGDTYEAIKEGFQTGDWSNALGIATDLFKAGISIWAVLELMSGTVSSLKTAISTGLGLAKAAGAMAAAGVGGTAGMLGILSIGIGLVEAWNTGDYEGFVENMLTSVLAAMVAFGLTGNVVVGATVFTLTFNMELGEIIANGLMTKFDKSIMSPIRNFFGIGINQPYMDAMNNPSFTPGTSLESREASNWEKFKDFLGFASGGFVSGPGTDTSDSIPAMLSNGEFVINAKATRQFLPILKAINSGNFGGFKIGGQVSQSVPAGVANTWALKAAGLEDNKALSYLAQIAEDSQSFGYIVDMVSGFQGMRADYEKQMEKLKEQQAEIQGQLKEELEKLQKDIEDQTNTFQASIKDLSGSLAGFANNLASITGSKTAGLVGGVLGQVGGFMDSYKNFGNATNLMGQLTSGFGMANAVLGAVGAFKSFNDARNQEARQQWQEQMNLDKEQLDAIKQIEYNTKETTANLVKYLAQNPTNSNIAGGKAVLDNVYNSLRSNLRPNFGRISYNVEEDDVWFDDEKTVRYGPEQFLRKMGIGTSGSLGNMGVDELQNVYNQVRGISHGQLKGVAQDIADTMDAGWAGSGELKRWSTNFGSFKSKLGNYLNTLKDLESTLGSLQQNTRLEGFAGVEFLNASERVDAYRKQVEDFFKASGKNISSHQKEIDQMVSEYANKVVDGGERIITIMQDVRGSFIQAFSGGETALNSFASAVRPFFDTMKSNIASLFYDIDADSLDAQFKKFFGNFTDKLANYSGNNIMGYVQNLLGNGQLDKLFNQMISLQNIAEDMADINTLIAEQFREQAQNAGLTKEEIDGLLEQMGLLSQEAEQVAAYMDELKNSLKSAMSAAMESGDLIDFSKTLGESIYENAKEGLIQAFMESEVYQEMFKKWFDSSELALTGNLEQDFDNMNDMLDQLRQELNEAGLNFGFGDVPTGGDTGGSDDYYVPTGEGEPAKIVENHYHYDPRIQNLYGDDKETLFEEFLSWKEDQENSSA